MMEKSKNLVFTNMKKKEKAPVKITVVGVGGCGGNSIKKMYDSGIEGVNYLVINTDVQALNDNPVSNQIQIGERITNGTGAGGDPAVGKKAALESEEDIKNKLNNGTKMLFITAGLGKGTGTGASPEVARIAKNLEMLVVGIVTAPPKLEQNAMRLAIEGLANLRHYCDVVIVIMNQKLIEIYSDNTMNTIYKKGTNILYRAVKGIAEIITIHFDQNVDFSDVTRVLKNAKTAVIATAEASGPDRIQKAVEDVFNSNIINTQDFYSAKKQLIALQYDEGEKGIKGFELEELTELLKEKTGIKEISYKAERTVKNLGDKIILTLIAADFDLERINYGTSENPIYEESFTPNVQDEKKNNREEKIHSDSDTNDSDTNGSDLQEFDLDGEESFSKLEEDDEKKIDEEEFENLYSDENEEDTQFFKPLKGELTKEEIKELNDTPAYIRQNIKLHEITPSKNPKLSKFHLDYNNEISEDNSYFTDNAD